MVVRTAMGNMVGLVRTFLVVRIMAEQSKQYAWRVSNKVYRSDQAQSKVRKEVRGFTTK